MWMLGETPQCWKTSHTILLYKKGDHTDPANYRPIGLNNTMGKLWTAMTTTAIASFAEQLGILSAAQEGFRAHRSTHRQILNLIHDIEDAALYKQDLYAAFFDFKSAFNMVDHDKLLCIMFDLGFPTDAIDVVRSIYTEARTHITHHNMEGPGIPISRGTIQGDTLSPLLFLIFIEPLHRWLQAGGRGYRQGCLANQPALQEQFNTGSLGYADDTTAITNNPHDLQIQCTKVYTYSQWAGIPLNYTKCEVTGILHHTHPQDPTNEAILKAQLHNKITMGNAHAKYTPPTQPCKYLGLHISLNLDWQPQAQITLQMIRDKGGQILKRAIGSGASSRQGLHLIQTCIKPAVAYTMIGAPYTDQDIAQMDRAIASITKRCCRLPTGFPNAAIHSPTSEAGLGISSLMMEYTQITTATLTRAMNDQGKLGHITRALLPTQSRCLGDTRIEDLPSKAAKYLSIMRQFHILHQAQIRLHLGDKDVTDTLLPLMTRLSQMGDGIHLPPAVLFPLHQLGIRNHTQLINPEGTHIICCNALQNMFGTKVKASHRRSLNRASLLISQQPPPGYTSNLAKYAGTEALPAQCRKLPKAIAPRHEKSIKHLLSTHPLPKPQAAPKPQMDAHTHQTPDTTPPSLPLTGTKWWHLTPLAGDTPADWELCWQQCTPLMDSPFFQYHRLNNRSTWAHLKKAVLNPMLEPTVPPRLLHLLYSSQYKVNRILSSTCKRDWEGNPTREKVIQWEPISIRTHHLPAYDQLASPLHQIISTHSHPDDHEMSILPEG
jgi:hypothetical protein